MTRRLALQLGGAAVGLLATGVDRSAGAVTAPAEERSFDED